jgi:enamine deaminase RidA (YjgF/YER057c/UK114 family)
VRLNTYVTDRAYLRPYMEVRDRLFAHPAPASTLMIVSGFARPEFKVEVEATAAG